MVNSHEMGHEGKRVEPRLDVRWSIIVSNMTAVSFLIIGRMKDSFPSHRHYV